jgi:virginiamycin B lyase
MKKWAGLWALMFGGVLCTSLAQGTEISGRVTEASGKPVPYVRVRVTGPDGVAPYSRSVFTTEDGTYSVDYGNADTTGFTVEAFRIGWRETRRNEKKSGQGTQVDVTMRREANVADQVPPSAWLQGDPESQAYQMTTLQCSNCHQVGSTRVRNFSKTLADLPVGDRSEKWVTRAADDLATDKKSPAGVKIPGHTRVEGWEAIVQYMRYVTMYLGKPPQLRWNLKEGSAYYNALLVPATSLFIPQDMAIVVPNLARNFPVKFDTLTGYDDLKRLGPYGVTKKTVVDEFVLPTFGWTREVAITPTSNKVYFVETDKDRLGGLDPTTGKVAWYPIPGKGRQGPHTMNSDANGNIWAGLEDSFNIARFDTAKETWRLYPPPPNTLFGVTHDFAFNTDRHVEPDSKGRIWITDMGTNELWGINVTSGEIKTYRMPVPAGESHFHSLIYGAAQDTQHKRVWYAQLFGNVGSLDTEHDIAERIIPFRKGAGPRRLALQEDGTLWIPLFGAGQLVKVNGDTGAEMARYSFPDRGAAPYGITYDRRRNAIWAATSNSDRIYRFDIATQHWTQYPLPRRESYIRMIELDPRTNDVWTSYAALPVGERDPKIFGTASANNMIVRLQPGD